VRAYGYMYMYHLTGNQSLHGDGVAGGLRGSRSLTAHSVRMPCLPGPASAFMKPNMHLQVVLLLLFVAQPAPGGCWIAPDSNGHVTIPGNAIGWAAFSGCQTT
jgi:hypothetical protein